MKQRNAIFDDLRGLCMLGVIAIHVGSMAVTAEAAGPFLVLVTNILSRYSVPAFFFISGFGLFYSTPLDVPLHYGTFIKKRLRSIGRPYVLASLLYLCYYAWVARDLSVLSPGSIAFALFFGTGQYHIYFLVILLWFYLLFPLWRLLMKAMERTGLALSLGILFILQVMLYRFSLHFWVYPDWIARNDFLLNLCNYRLNYFPFFYVFIFMLGGIIARHYQGFDTLITRHKVLLTVFFLTSALTNTLLFARWTFHWQMPYEDTINALQQLSLPGLIYTIACVLFFSMVLRSGHYPCKNALRSMSSCSFVIYLIHPVFIDQLGYLADRFGGGLKNTSMLLFYLAVLFLSWACALLWRRLKKQRQKA